MGYIAKYDEDGNQEWIKQYGTTTLDSSFNASVTGDSSGDFYIAGHTAGDWARENADKSIEIEDPSEGQGKTDAVITKFDTHGNEQWRVQFGSPSLEDNWGLALDQDGNVFAGGNTRGNFIDEDIVDQNPYDVWLINFDSGGNEQWRTQFGTDDDDFLWAIDTDSRGNIYAAGWTQGAFEGQENQGGYDAWLAKYDNDGNQVWIEQFGTSGDDAVFYDSLAIDSNDDIYLAGNTDSDFGGANAGSYDAWVAKYDKDGNQQWVQQFGTSGYDTATTVSIDDDFNLYVSGTTDGSIGDSNAGSFDSWVAKLDTDDGEIQDFSGDDTDLDLVGSDTYKVLESYAVDFETTASGDQLLAGTSITNQYNSFSGLTISTPKDEFGAMIFDSANPTGGDFDLATEDQGNVLIISQDGDSSDPNDQTGGGTIRFQWSDSVFVDSVSVNSIGLLDIDEAGGSIIAYDDDGDVLRTVAIPDFGDNSLGQVDINTADVAYLDVNLFGSGAITEVSFNSLSEVELV